MRRKLILTAVLTVAIGALLLAPLFLPRAVPQLWELIAYRAVPSPMTQTHGVSFLLKEKRAAWLEGDQFVHRLLDADGRIVLETGQTTISSIKTDTRLIYYGDPGDRVTLVIDSSGLARLP